MRISDWSSDVCSSDLFDRGRAAFANRRERCQTHRRDDRAGRRFDRGDRVARVGRTIEAGRTMHMHDVAELLYVELGSDARRDVLAARRAGEQHVAVVLGAFGNLRCERRGEDVVVFGALDLPSLSYALTLGPGIRRAPDTSAQ